MKNAIIEALNNLDNSDLIAIHNEYCEADNRPDDVIFDMCSFDEVFHGCDPLDIAKAARLGDLNPNADFFCLDGYGNPSSEIYDAIFVDDIADYIIDNDNDLGDCLVRDILDEGKDGDSDEE